MLSVQTLPQLLPLKETVSAWLLSEWPGWYGEEGPADLNGDVEAFARSESSLPVGFIVFRNTTPVGFAALKQESIPSHKHLTPWAAAAFVVPECRGQGVGTFMLRSVVAHAKKMGFPHVYSGTSTARTLLQRENWLTVENVLQAGKPLTIFRSAA